MTPLAVCNTAASPLAVHSLRTAGYTVFPLPVCPLLDAPVGAHADMLFFVWKKTVYLYKAYAPTVAATLLPLLAERGYTLCILPASENPEKHYPKDIRLNLLAVGNTAFCHKAASPTVLSALAKDGANICPVRQGYAHCGALALGKEALISADQNLLQAAQKNGLDCLDLRGEPILLPGYQTTGLFGGCGGADERTHTVYLTGTPHPNNVEALEAFCRKHTYSVCYLTDAPLCDIGGILFF